MHVQNAKTGEQKAGHGEYGGPVPKSNGKTVAEEDF
jgi:hypothetical protein